MAKGRWITKNGVHILLDENSTVLSSREENAINYWKGGKNGRGYVDIRAVANGGKSDTDNINNITKDFESAVDKAPSAKGETLVRVAGDWRIPGQGEPKVGQEFKMRKFESFSKSSEKDYDNLVATLGQGMKEEILFRVKATDNFKDISKFGKNNIGVASEHEVVTNSAANYKVTKITPARTEGTWVNPQGEQKYLIVDIEELNKK